MKIISHRGNLNGPDSAKENTIESIKIALSMGFDVEIDIWYKDKNYYLGHDSPKAYINKDFLLNKNLWCHAKNLDALKQMIEDKIHCFWHQEDDFTLTSENYIWTYPGKNVTPASVIVTNIAVSAPCYGICTDYPLRFKNETNS